MSVDPTQEPTNTTVNTEDEVTVPLQEGEVTGTLTLRKKERQWYGDIVFQKNQNHYVGQLATVDQKNVRPHGIGKMIMGNKEAREDTYSGEFQDGKPHGWGRMKYRDGVVYEGGWRQGIAHGKGRMIMPSGTEVEAIFLQGRPSGRGRITTRFGKHFEGKFLQGTRHVEGKLTFPSGAVYEGAIKNGKAFGSGKYTDKEGNVQTGKITFTTEDGGQETIL